MIQHIFYVANSRIIPDFLRVILLFQQYYLFNLAPKKNNPETGHHLDH